MMNDNFGFYDIGGRLHKVSFPTNDNATPPVNQLLGINDHGVATGFYTNAQGNNRGYTYNTHSRRFTRVLVPGSSAGTGPSLTAAAINNSGDIAGFYATAAGATDGFVKDGRHFTDLAFPGAAATMALGINDDTEVVGTYGGDRQHRGYARVHLAAIARVQHRRRPPWHGHHHRQRR